MLSLWLLERQSLTWLGAGLDCFRDPHLFIPERWTTRRELVMNGGASNPWGTGELPFIT